MTLLYSYSIHKSSLMCKTNLNSCLVYFLIDLLSFLTIPKWKHCLHDFHCLTLEQCFPNQWPTIQNASTVTIVWVTTPIVQVPESVIPTIPKGKANCMQDFHCLSWGEGGGSICIVYLFFRPRRYGSKGYILYK